MADEMVLKAQQWVNTTYGSVTGYVACPETGKTGWSTMYSLTRALQHELGITSLSDAFGPTTSSKMDARGPIGAGDEGTNFVKIVQAAFFCKGYHAGDIDGEWGSGNGANTHYAAESMMDDMGLGGSFADNLPTKVVKALLTMDAYVLLSGGNPEVRDIQRWLNQRYWKRSFGKIIPTEGHYSRDVQQALMKALQFEFGIPESQCTGNFGPGTQDGLRNHPLSQGASGIFVQLLSAACVFNGTVQTITGDTFHTVFKDSFDEPLTTYITEFQKFSLLAVSGAADYRTWCQLLVSMGDPDRPATACDTRFTITPAVGRALVEQGFRVVGRYLDEPSNGQWNKEIQPGELDNIFDAGLKVFPIWQYVGRYLENFTYESGRNHGNLAHDRMVFYGFDPGAVIYFAVDYDATDPDIDSNILPYFRGVQGALIARGRRYKTGVYASRNVCIRVTNETNAAASFVSGMSWGFSGNLGFPLPHNWAFNQIKEITKMPVAGSAEPIDLDRDVHRKAVDPGVGRAGIGSPGDTPLADLFADIDAVWQLALAYGGDPNRRVMEYYRSPGYTTQYKGWDLLLGAWDQEWIDHANDQLGQPTKTFRDPSTNEQVNLDHLAATANAYYLKGSGTGGSVSRGDFGGWGGDLASFLGDWQNEMSEWESGYAYCNDKLARRDVSSHFGYSDLVEDADGYLAGMACRGGAQFPTWLRTHLGGIGHASRFRQLFDARFGGDPDVAIAAGRTMLTDVGSDDQLDFLRNAVYVSVAGPFYLHPKDMSAGWLTPFLQGWAERLQVLAGVG